MMHKILSYFSIFFCFILSCAMSSRLLYDVSLDQVERPAHARQRYGKSKIIKLSGEGAEKYQFEDDMINVIWIVTSGGLSFELYNKTDHSIKIIWDEAAFVNVNGKSQRIMHSGVKYIDRNNPQPPSVIIRNGSISDVIIPTENVYYISGRYGGWREAPIFPNKNFGETTKQLIERAKPYIGQTIHVLLPLQIENVVNEYLFSFKINDILLSGNSIKNSGVTNLSQKNNSISSQNNLIFVKISKISKDYILILKGFTDGIQKGNKYEIYTLNTNLENEKIGICEAVKVLEDKSALKIIEMNNNHKISLEDKVKYK